jgi:hypothetical protein
MKAVEVFIYPVELDKVLSWIIVSSAGGLFFFKSPTELSRFLDLLGLDILLKDLEKPITIQEFKTRHPEYGKFNLEKSIKD